MPCCTTLRLSPGSRLYLQNQYGGLAVFDTTDPGAGFTELLDNTTFRTLNHAGWTVGANEKWLLVEHDRVGVFRHSAESGYTAVGLGGAGQMVRLGITNTTTNITRARAHMKKRPIDNDMI